MRAPTALFHFVFVESLPFALFYLSARSVLRSEVQITDKRDAYEATGLINNIDCPIENVYDNRTLLFAIIADDCAEQNLWTFTDMTECVTKVCYQLVDDMKCGNDWTFVSKRYLTVAHYCVLCLCLSVVVYGSLQIVLQDGILCSFAKGSYMRFTWEFEKSFVDRAVASLLVLGLLALFGWEVRADSLDFLCSPKSGIGWGRAVIVVTWRYVLQLVVMIASVHRMTCSRPPALNWTSAEFGNYIFTRHWRDLVTQPNDVFGYQLMNALFGDENGHSQALDAIVAKSGDNAVVQQFCRQPLESCAVGPGEASAPGPEEASAPLIEGISVRSFSATTVW